MAREQETPREKSDRIIRQMQENARKAIEQAKDKKGGKH